MTSEEILEHCRRLASEFSRRAQEAETEEKRRTYSDVAEKSERLAAEMSALSPEGLAALTAMMDFEGTIPEAEKWGDLAYQWHENTGKVPHEMRYPRYYAEGRFVFDAWEGGMIAAADSGAPGDDEMAGRIATLLNRDFVDVMDAAAARKKAN